MLQDIVNQRESLKEMSLEWGMSSCEKGEVFTKPSVVDFMVSILDFQDNILDKNTRVLEPSCGSGEFVITIVKKLCNELRVLESKPTITELFNKIFAFDISKDNINKAKCVTSELLNEFYLTAEINQLLENWFHCEDFLLWDTDIDFSHIIGNPPYIRIENVPVELLAEYRFRYETMTQRADIYIAFFEKSIELLRDSGRFIFICTDRWMKNQYGKKLREFISVNCNLSVLIDLYGQEAFQSDVLTYPAITVIEKKKKSHTLVITDRKIESLDVDSIINFNNATKNGNYRNDIVNGDRPWLYGDSTEIELIGYLESKYLALEDAGCNVYIGAATGNNEVYISDVSLNIESDRKIPVIRASDIKNGELKPSNKIMVNTYDHNGVIELCDYPLLEAYLTGYKDVLSSRHVAKNNPLKWFKTIDRIHSDRAKEEKLLIPDIKSRLTIVHDKVGYHPNNSIYYICSSIWDLRALKVVLESGIGQLFVESYSTKISGGNLRFQAQHLRKIRIPDWSDMSDVTKLTLIGLYQTPNNEIKKQVISDIYKLTEEQLQVLGW